MLTSVQSESQSPYNNHQGLNMAKFKVQRNYSLAPVGNMFQNNLQLNTSHKPTMVTNTNMSNQFKQIQLAYQQFQATMPTQQLGQNKPILMGLKQQDSNLLGNHTLQMPGGSFPNQQPQFDKYSLNEAKYTNDPHLSECARK